MVVSDPTDSVQSAGAGSGHIVVLTGVDGSEPPGPEGIRLLSAGVAALVLKASTELDRAWQTDEGPAVLVAERKLPWLDFLSAISSTVGTNAGPAAAGASLSELVDDLAGEVGANILVEDIAGHVLAHSASGEQIDDWRRDAILAKRSVWPTSVLLRRHGVQPRAMAGGTPIRFTMPGARDRLVAELPGDRAVSGYIWAALPWPELTEDEVQALAESIRRATAEMGRAVSLLGTGRRAESARRTALVRSALEHPDATTLNRIGLAPASQVVVFAARFPTPADGPDELDRLRARLETDRDSRIVVVLDDVLAVIDRADDKLRDRTGSSITNTGATATVVEGPAAELGALFERARAVLEEAPRLPRLYEVRHVWGALCLRTLAARPEDDTWGSGGALPLLRHDAEHGTAYVLTLRRYLEHFGDVKATARGLGVHPNTIRYRLGVIRKMLDVDLDNPDNRLVLHLQLAVLERRGAGLAPAPRHQSRVASSSSRTAG
ncbi:MULTISPECIES: CdaR family transcriptional regulator [unclassified Amycolatopsis]|uniref:PucR family transcriptional regulator n=1 Tax=unclassified Amycolatopsis TaxID=2618356 RepID=UPI001C6A2315|nr:helix-turn-helix domain-containing protein [Amycolatopsis sp. DSM 110486]QYN20421.1 helix-turn-helix domain-containing protein [Amycolatopsis sp. DSM 110486]